MTHSLAHKIGFWSSLLFTILGLVLIAANIGIGFSGQWQTWEGMESYAAWYSTVRVNFFTIVFIASFLMTILFLGIMAALHSLAPDEKRILGTLGTSFTAICVTLVSITYYTQLSIVHNSIQSEQVEELARFVYHNPNSFVFAIDILGFFFLGLAALCVAPLLEGTAPLAFYRIRRREHHRFAGSCVGLSTCPPPLQPADDAHHFCRIHPSRFLL